ncbi:MAG: methylated-DNA--[protein]-cysteine S-methyltransferase [Hyphomicrobiales bacterium]|nr:methylated-DNA--[protein]-cysteine S-methyltransferase [Hyphomicrobiales bacterium]
MDTQSYAVFATAHGFVAIGWSGGVVTALRLPGKSEAAAELALLRRAPGAVRAAPSPAIAARIEAIKRYFAGAQIDFSDVAIDLGPQEPFFALVYERVRKLGWGETSTYGAIAKELSDDPRAARDVGQAMATNPVPLIVPCHRVLAAGARIGGFSAPGGSHAKAKMLELEGVRRQAPEKPEVKQASFDF